MSQQYAQPTPPQGPPPKKVGAGKIVGFSCLGIVGLVVISAVAGLAGSSDPKKEAAPPAAAGVGAAPSPVAKAAPPGGAEGDVQIKTCEVDPSLGWAKAGLTITNRSSKTSNYMVQVEFVDASGTRLGDALAATNNLAPGQSAQNTAQGLDQIKSKITCKVTKVTRYAS
ncbi:FxLYD domain-containing protein [Streptomyces sp. NPDC086989]|uniref:FxLYD domain-containing protein n=1 Tax=Streptomyces sp. NPDC086989 TaxID=3365764 RepID=UPI0038163F4B